MTYPIPAPVVQTIRGAVSLIRIDNPPVNALGFAVRQGLLQALDSAEADVDVRAVLIVGAGKAFIGGADIREFGKTPLFPFLPQVCDRIEASDKIVVAAIHGPALGGGLEVALAAHYRVALRSARLGLPEVQLGLLPGAGGAQRAPRLMGAKAAAELMLGGQPLSAHDALAAGLIDRVANVDDAEEAGVAYVEELIAQCARPRRTRDIEIADKAAAKSTLDALEADTAKKSRGLFSSLKIVECVRAAVELPFEQGIARERELFLECMDSPQRAGLIHAFFAERDVVKIPEAAAARRGTSSRLPSSVGARWARASPCPLSTRDCPSSWSSATRSRSREVKLTWRTSTTG